MKIRIILTVVFVYALVSSCYVKTINTNSGMPCGVSPAPIFNFTFEDKSGRSLLSTGILPRFYTINNEKREYKNQEWEIKSFVSDTSQKYVSAKTIWGFPNSSTTFYIEEASGKTSKVEVVISNNPSDPQCPNAYFYKRVAFNEQVIDGEVKDKTPYYRLKLQ